MPYENEHACRLRDPGKFQADSFRRTSRKSDGKTYDVIMGKLEGEDSMTEQAYRYPKDAWDADEARSHCESHDGISFEPAVEEKQDVQDGEDMGMIKDDEERRSFVVEELRVVQAEGVGPSIQGYAAVFGKRSEVLGDFVEQIEPGFFAPALKHDVRALWNHNTDLVLGRTKNKTLALEEDEKGLRVVINPPDTQWGRDAMELIRRGDVNQMSFGFSVKPGGDEWSSESNKIRVRTLKAGGCKALYDVSPVTFPAYPQTSAQVRAMVESLSHSEGDEPGQEPGEKESRKARARSRRRRLQIESLR